MAKYRYSSVVQKTKVPFVRRKSCSFCENLEKTPEPLEIVFKLAHWYFWFEHLFFSLYHRPLWGVSQHVHNHVWQLFFGFNCSSSTSPAICWCV